MELIKQLRERTGAGMVDCKQALDESGNDLEKAVEILRKKGIAKAAKREGRETKEGIVKIAVSADNRQGLLVEFNAETDFVVRNEQFQKFADDVMAVAVKLWPDNLEALLNTVMDDGNSIKNNLESLSGVIGEKLDISRLEKVSASGAVAGYSHSGGRIGALVALSVSDIDLAREVAMQVAAANPRYISPADVAADEIAKEKEVYAEQLKNEGKPAEMIEKITEGKLAKFYEGICLTKQEYIKDDKQKVEGILKGATVEKFVRFAL